MTSEVDVGDMAVEVEPSHQYSVTFFCHATDCSRGAAWQNGIWHGIVYEAKMCHWTPPWGNSGTQWHSLTLAGHFCRLNSGCEHRKAAGGAFQQWQQQQWSTSTGCSVQALVIRWWKCTPNCGDSVEKQYFVAENLLSQTVIVLFLSVVVSMKTYRRHYF